MIPPQREINKIIKLALNRTHETSMFTTKSESETLPSFPFILFSKFNRRFKREDSYVQFDREERY